MISIEVVIQVVVGIMVGITTTMIINLREEWKKDREHKQLEDELMKQAMRELLGKIIDDMYTYYTDVGFIPLEKLHQVRRIYDKYHGLGGNGTGTAMMNCLERLPNRKEDIR